MLTGLRSISPSSETMSEGILERNRAEKALITRTPTHSQIFHKNIGVKNYSDKNGNDVIKAIKKGRKTFAFWTLVCLLFILAIGNLILTFTILAVLRLGQGMETMEFLPEHNAIKFFGEADFDHVYKKDGMIESFRDTPMSITGDNGSVMLNLQIKSSRYENKVTINSSGVFIRGVNAMELIDPDSGEVVFSTASPDMNIPDGVNNLNVKQISTKRITSPIDEDLKLHTENSAYLRGAEGTRMESKELFWSADQDIYLKSINGSVVLSGKDGVFIDVRLNAYTLVPNLRAQLNLTNIHKLRRFGGVETAIFFLFFILFYITLAVPIIFGNDSIVTFLETKHVAQLLHFFSALLAILQVGMVVPLQYMLCVFGTLFHTLFALALLWMSLRKESKSISYPSI